MLVEIRQCSNHLCELRFPSSEQDWLTPRGERPSAIRSHKDKDTCPRCGNPTKPVTTFEPSQDITGSAEFYPSEDFPLPNMVGFLDNIRSTWNVGSIFRTADGVGIKRLYLAGITPTPEHTKVSATALGAENTVEWSYHPNGLQTVRFLKQEGYLLLALESGRLYPQLPSYSIMDAAQLFFMRSDQSVALIMGNERYGIDPETVNECHAIVWIPMQGLKGSLNVALAFGIAAYYLRFAYLASEKK